MQSNRPIKAATTFSNRIYTWFIINQKRVGLFIIWLGSICLPLHAATIETNNQNTNPIINANVGIQPTDQIVLPSRDQELPIPADGNCLYNALMIDYLLPVANDLDIFRVRLGMLVGDDLIESFEEKKDDNDSKDDEKKDDHDLWDSKKLCQEFQNLNKATVLNNLRQEPFTKLVKDFRRHMGMGNRLWGGPTAIEIIANLLQVTIEEYTSDPDDTSRLTEPKSINPEHKSQYLRCALFKTILPKKRVLTNPNL